MYLTIKEPTKKISSHAVNVWRMSNTIGHTVALIILAVLLYCSHAFGWYSWVPIVLYIFIGLFTVSAIYSIFIEPTFLQRTWRYEVDEEFIQLKEGKWNESHTIIPMEKVEVVKTEQGPLLRKFHLYNIVIGTTTSSHTIPAIPKDLALDLKARIATFAKVTEDDVAEGEVTDESE
ncbi:Bacterial membrane flanked domain protein [Bacillus sp. THAF10]|uniref:PH domain-containing protein n=1 Tax=Bacillus sp. THAF10 TaxID=2587848 RepID=UPI001267C2AE|nr:PH domain-containing protein [Bacillus sp. THAF10]QFT91087.1 Bacterial membrane flanked domain protein [Bacillus sp. THAF10]